MGQTEITYAWAPITKAERQEDGSVIVTGQLTDAGRDRDGQAMSQEWLDRAVPKWFDESGNIREQHNAHSAAGVGIGLVRKADGAYILQSRITDPVAAAKCVPAADGERAVYQGYSIGIRQPRLSFEKAEFPAGEVVDGYICESSLADRPSNPRSLFAMAKSDGPDEEPYLVGEEVELDGPAPTQDAEPDEVDKVDDIVKMADEDGDAGYDHPYGGENNWAAWDEAHKGLGRVGTRVVATHPGGGTVTGHVVQRKDNGMLTIAHQGTLFDVSRESVAHAAGDNRVPGTGRPEPPRTSLRGVPKLGDMVNHHVDKKPKTPKELDPDTRDAARRQAEHDETERLGRSAMGEGMFAAAVRQATAANARRLARAKTEEPDLAKSAKARKKITKAAAALVKKRAAALGIDADMDSDDSVQKIESLGLLLKAAGWILDDLCPSEAPAIFKTDAPEEFTDMDKSEVAAMITAAITDATKGFEQLVSDAVAGLAGRLEKVEASPVPGGPQQMRSSGQLQLARTSEVKRATEDRIASLEQRANMIKSEDPELSRGYFEQAQELRRRLNP